MMQGILAHGRAIARARAADLIEALVEAAETELPADLTVESSGDGIAVSGRGLARRLAFDGRLRGLTRGLRR